MPRLLMQFRVSSGAKLTKFERRRQMLEARFGVTTLCHSATLVSEDRLEKESTPRRNQETYKYQII